MNSTLDRIIELNKNYPKLRKEKGYNVFSVLQIQSKEVLTCRFLADLLNPRGQHGSGSAFLKLFFDEVLKIPIHDANLFDNAIVTAEYTIDDERRIDIVIEIGKRFIPIEVKIYAEDRKSQCYDYYTFAKQRDSAAKVYYLTRTGYSPSEYSLSGNNGVISIDEIICISFRDDILSWLHQCIDIAKMDVKEVIKQFAASIEMMSGNANERMINVISEELYQSEEALRAGIQISESLNTAKAKLIREVFIEFEEQMKTIAKKYNFTRESTIGWYEYETQANASFYDSKNYSTYPGINYIVNDAKMNDGYQLWFRIEVEHNLYAGFCVFNPNVFSEDGQGEEVDDYTYDTRKSLNELLNVSEADQDSWWAVWRYLPSGDKRESDIVPNFKSMNDAAISLADLNKRKDFVKQCIEQIDVLIQRVMK